MAGLAQGFQAGLGSISVLDRLLTSRLQRDAIGANIALEMSKLAQLQEQFAQLQAASDELRAVLSDPARSRNFTELLPPIARIVALSGNPEQVTKLPELATKLAMQTSLRNLGDMIAAYESQNPTVFADAAAAYERMRTALPEVRASVQVAPGGRWTVTYTAPAGEGRPPHSWTAIYDRPALERMLLYIHDKPAEFAKGVQDLTLTNPLVEKTLAEAFERRALGREHLAQAGLYDAQTAKTRQETAQSDVRFAFERLGLQDQTAVQRAARLLGMPLDPKDLMDMLTSPAQTEPTREADRRALQAMTVLTPLLEQQGVPPSVVATDLRNRLRRAMNENKPLTGYTLVAGTAVGPEGEEAVTYLTIPGLDRPVVIPRLVGSALASALNIQAEFTPPQPRARVEQPEPPTQATARGQSEPARPGSPERLVEEARRDPERWLRGAIARANESVDWMPAELFDYQASLPVPEQQQLLRLYDEEQRIRRELRELQRNPRSLSDPAVRERIVALAAAEAALRAAYARLHDLSVEQMRRLKNR